MEKSTLVPAASIVAEAMSTANLITAPDSPRMMTAIISPEASPRCNPVPMIGSPAQHIKSSCDTKVPSTESMDIKDNLPTPRSFVRQRSQDSDTQSQQSMEAAQVISVAQMSSKDNVDDKAVVLRTDGKDTHLVTVTPPSSFPHPAVNGDGRLQQAFAYERSEKPSQMNTLPVNVQRLAKGDSQTDMHPRPKEDATYSITCGNNRADLVWKKFICPGINAKCVKCGDNWYTPKEFVHVAGKSTLKDWKRAIRINGIMLRKMIENGELNYYDHESNCSNQCRSNKSSSFDSSNEKSFNSLDSDTSAIQRELPMESCPARSSSEELAHNPTKRLPPANYRSYEGNTSLQGANSMERSSSEDSGLAPSPHLEGMLMREAAVTVEKVHDLFAFWNGIIRMDLFDDIMRDVHTQVSNLQSKTNHTGMISVEDVVTMTNLVNSLEMIPSIVHKMSLHKHTVEKQAEESNQAIQELEKKLAEQKKYEQDLKRKSQHLDNVISLTPNEKRQKRNIMRIVRQTAVEGRIPPGSMPGTSSPVPTTIRDSVMIGSTVGGRHLQRGEMWPQAIQVDGTTRAASSQLARMNVSGNTPQGIPIPPFPIFSHPNIHTSSEGFATNSLHQAFVNPQAVHHSSREGTQSPKK